MLKGEGGRSPLWGGLWGTVRQPCHCLFILKVLKSTADVVGGRALYEAYSAVTDEEPERFLTLRHTVLLRKEARKLFIQANTCLEGKSSSTVDRLHIVQFGMD